MADSGSESFSLTDSDRDTAEPIDPTISWIIQDDEPAMTNVGNELIALKRKVDQLLSLLAYCKIDVPEKDVNEAERLLRTALDLGGLEPVVNQCAQVLDKSLNAQNAIKYFNFAQEKKIGELNDATREYILRNFNAVYTHEDWLNLKVEHLKWFLTHDDLNAPEEDSVFKALLLWVRKDRNRNAHMEGLMLSTVRLYLCDHRFLSSSLKDHYLLWDKETFQKSLMQVITDKEEEPADLQAKIDAARRNPQS